MKNNYYVHESVLRLSKIEKIYNRRYRRRRRFNINYLKCAENGFINNEEGD